MNYFLLGIKSLSAQDLTNIFYFINYKIQLKNIHKMFTNFSSG